VHIVIEIVDKRPVVPPRRLRGFTFWQLALLLLALAAHADDGGIRYEHWQDIGNSWHGEVRTQGTTTHQLGQLWAARRTEAVPSVFRRRHGLHVLPLTARTCLRECVA
jgi:hypothetical protein